MSSDCLRFWHRRTVKFQRSLVVAGDKVSAEGTAFERSVNRDSVGTCPERELQFASFEVPVLDRIGTDRSDEVTSISSAVTAEVQ